jgi:hypothetical protein
MRDYKREYELSKLNPETVSKRQEYLKNWKNNNKDKIAAHSKKKNDEYAKNPTKRISKTMSTRINRLISDKGNKTWLEYVDYTLEDLLNHLESLFLPGMTWDNHGKGENCWHIDHIRPVISFKFNSFKDLEFKQCWSLSNLQPLWEKDNLSKGGKTPK